jgi:biopolymer transport protein ExbB
LVFFHLFLKNTYIWGENIIKSKTIVFFFMKTKPKNNSSSTFQSLFAVVAIPVVIIISYTLFIFVLGNSANFEGGNPVEGHPKNFLGTIHKGGIAIVPILISCALMVVTFSIERFLTITMARGRGSVSAFVGRVKSHLDSGNVDAAMAECEKQKGSVGNVIVSVLGKYKSLLSDTSMDKDQKIAALQKELEDSTSLELPMLEKNLSIIATLASVSTLIGLLGTVIGMIKAFSAMGASGTPNPAELSLGISEALINTALGIGSSAFAIVAYNFFTTNIDTLSYSIDEAG